MVRASRNQSNARRTAADPSSLYDWVDQAVGERYSLAPGEVFSRFAAEALERDPALAVHLTASLGLSGLASAAVGRGSVGALARAAQRGLLPAGSEPPAAAALDRYPFAKSWGSFLAAIRTQDKTAMAAIRNATMSERIPSEGGFLVPWQLQEQILALMTTAIVRPQAMYVPVAGLRAAVPFLENGDQSTAGQALGGLNFSLIAEGGTFPATNPEFGRTVLEVTKVGAYLKNVPNELLADASAFTEVFLPTIIARGLAFFEDDLFIASGNGVGQPQALLNSPAALAVSRATSDAVVLADLIGMIKGLHPESLPTASWLISKSAHDQILDLYTVDMLVQYVASKLA